MSEEKRLTLSTLEQHLAVLQDIESEISPEQEAEFQLALHEALTKVAEKRDRVAHVIEDLLRQARLADDAARGFDAICQRYIQRETRFKKAAERLKDYVLSVMRTLPKPAKGPRRLEGATSTLKANGVAPSVEVLDESQVPLEYKRVTVKIGVELWQLVCERYGVDPKIGKYEVDRTALLEALKKPCEACAHLEGTACENGPCQKCNGTSKQLIPGARLDDTKLRLVIE